MTEDTLLARLRDHKGRFTRSEVIKRIEELEAAAQASPPVVSSNGEERCWEWPQAVIVSVDADGVHVALWRDGQWEAAP